MRKLIDITKELFSHGISDKISEKEFYILLRVQSLLFLLYFFILSILLAANQQYILTFFSLASCGIMCISYVFTMIERLHLSLSLLTTTFFLASCLFSIFSGFNFNYYWIIILLIPILYFNTESTINEHIPYATIIILSILILFLFDLFTNSLAPISNQKIQILNMFLLLLSLTTSSFLGKEQFLNSENQILQANEQLRNMANRDALTQLYNRRAMQKRLRESALSYTKNPNPFCIAIGDIDFFKKINDEYGHDAGDAILIAFGSLLSSFMEKRGYVARWGGEEFLFCFTNVELEDAKKQLELLLDVINQHEFHFQDKTILVHMTVGIEVYQEHLGIENTISRADNKLYLGKSSGRNKVVS